MLHLTMFATLCLTSGTVLESCGMQSEIVNMRIMRHLLVFLMHLSIGTLAERFSNGYYYQDIVNGNGGSMLIHM